MLNMRMLFEYTISDYEYSIVKHCKEKTVSGGCIRLNAHRVQSIISPYIQHICIPS